MKQKTALIIAAGATAFMLVTAGAVIQVTSSQAVAQTAVSVKPTATLAVPASDPNAQQYKQLIDEANSRIQQLKDENARLRQQMQAGNTASSATTGQISADAAAQAALNLAPGAQLVSTPELVEFRGAPAYEVVLDAGTVYIDAGSGQPVYAVSARQRDNQQFERGDHDDEHDEHEQFENHEGSAG